MSIFFFFNATATTEIYTLSLHDALPILKSGFRGPTPAGSDSSHDIRRGTNFERTRSTTRSEEHTSELQSHSDLVCRLLLEKKKKKKKKTNNIRKKKQMKDKEIILSKTYI